jgi:hypothetical protein
MRRRLFAAAAVVVCALALPSCAGKGWKACHPATGRVVLNGKPVAGAEVWLVPTSGELKGQNPTIAPYGKTAADGTFSLTTYAPNDGAPAGQYTAKVICEKRVKNAAPNPDDDRPATRNVLPARYADPDRSGLTVTIQPGNNVIPDFDLKQ